MQAGMRGWGEIFCFFGTNALQIAILVLHSPSTLSTSKKHMAGDSSLRGKVGPIWVRKILNCLGEEQQQNKRKMLQA
jgi:hypothetical protein